MRDDLALNAQSVQANSSRVIAWLTAALVFISVISGFVSFLQFRAAKDSANAALAASITAMQQLRIAEDANRLTMINTNLGERQSRAALSASIDQNRWDQRAWVGVVDVIPPWLENGKRVYIKVAETGDIVLVISNSGRTPARKMKINAATAEGPKGKTFRAEYRDDGIDVSSLSTLFPAAQFNVRLSTKGAIPYYSLIKSGDYVFYIFGEITYDDVFNRRHSTTFCFFTNADVDAANACDTYNDAN
jgi:hypothetical protein